MAVELLGIENRTLLEVGVTGPEDARTLVIGTGVAKFVFRGIGNEFLRSQVIIPTGVQIDAPSFASYRGATVFAALASIANDGPANNAGWAMDSAEPFVAAGQLPPDGEFKIVAHLAVRDSDGFLLRIAYQVHVLLTRDPRPM